MPVYGFQQIRFFYLFLIYYHYINQGDTHMQQDNGKNIPARDRLIEALKTQINKQDEIIKTQNETIRILMEHNDELMAVINKLSR